MSGANSRLKQTQCAQPALYVVNSLPVFKAVIDGARPTHVAGHHRGEYNTLAVAGVFDFMTGLCPVKKRGELMARTHDDGMSAVIGRARHTFATVPREGGAAFLSRYMQACADEFAGFLQAFTFGSPRIPGVSNVTAEPHPADSAANKALLVRQITQPVEWTRGIRWLLAQGVTDVRETGPGNVPGRLLQQISRRPFSRRP